jgi:VWFA-related protein
MTSTARLGLALAAYVAGGAVVGVAGQQGPSTFGKAVDAVRVDVLVVDDKGVPLDGLTPDDFEISDNGVDQQLELLAFGELPLNVIMAFDTSQSTQGERLLQLRIGARNVLANLKGRDRAALLTFSDSIRLRQPLTADLGLVRTAMDSVSAAGGTMLVDGAYAALMLAGSDAGRDLVMVFSDGLDTDSVLGAARVLDTARRTDAVVYGVTAGNSGRVGFVSDLSRLSGGQSIEIAADIDLQKAFAGIVEQFRRRYVLSFTPRGVSGSGWHRLQVRVKGRRATVTARQGYTAGS